MKTEVIQQIDLSEGKLVYPDGTPVNFPPVPKNYLVFEAEGGHFFTSPPPDKRKSRGRVKDERPRFWLKEDMSGQLEWVPENDYNTRPVREFMLRQGLEMEIKFPGMKMTAKAPKCSTILRQEYGMVGKPLDLYVQFCKFRKQKIDPKLAERALKEGMA